MVDLTLTRRGFTQVAIVLASIDILLATVTMTDCFVGQKYGTRWGTMNLPKPWSGLGPIHDVSMETNVPTWYSSMKYLFLTIIWVVIAKIKWAESTKAERLIFKVWPALFAFMSLDEVAMLHERFGSAIRLVMWKGWVPWSGSWILVGAPAAILLFGVAYGGSRRLLSQHPREIRIGVAGLALLLFSSMIIEQFGALTPIGSISHAVETVLEELGELLGVTFMIYASGCLLASLDLALDRLDVTNRPNMGRTEVSTLEVTRSHIL